MTIMISVKSLNYLKYNIALLKVVSLLKLANTANIYEKIIHHFWRMITSLVCSFTFASVLVDTVQKRNQAFENSIMNYMYLGATFYISCRTYYYYFFDNRTEAFINCVNRTFKYESQTGLEEKNMYRSMEIVKWMSLLWCSTGFFIATGFIVLPVLLGGYTKKTLSFPGWYPFDWSVSPSYEITILLQVFIQVTLGTLASTTDMFYASSCLLVAEQFEILSWDIKNLLYSTLLKHGVSKETVIEFRSKLNDCMFQEHRHFSFEEQDHFSMIYAAVDSPKFRTDITNSFHNLVKFHKSLISLVENMESFFSPLALIYFLPITIVIMMLAYIVTTTNNMTVILINGVSGSWMLFEVWLLSYFAELIKQKSEEVHTNLYDLPWYLCDKKLTRGLQIMLLRSAVPVTLTVGKFKNLGLNMFVWTAKSVYSFTAVLRDVNQRN